MRLSKACQNLSTILQRRLHSRRARGAGDSRIGELQSQIATASAAGAPPGGGSDPAPLKAVLATRQSRLEQVKLAITKIDQAAQGGSSAGLLQDILSDATGYSLHRFQIVAWTAVLGVIFVASVYNTLKMPEFSTNLLALMGISAGTYIGFKFPEK